MSVGLPCTGPHLGLGGHDVGRRNPIQFIGEPAKTGYTVLADDLIRAAAHDETLGVDGFAVMAFLVSWASSTKAGKRPWETSPMHLSEVFGWSRNRERANKAIAAAEKDRRLIIRRYVRDGVEVARRCSYLVCAGGRQFTDGEIGLWSRPIELPPKSSDSEDLAC